ncbi:MAG: flagellar hook-associated protein FlgL [Deltaproteobacteria bacterium]|nr:flagellar hook-associated protein FlgL [Deltaproteobacteria bacterium]
MRVTQNMLSETTARTLGRATRELLELRERAASGRQVARPSDDPAGISRIFDFRDSLAAMDQYTRTINEGLSRLTFAESNINQMQQLVQRAQEIAVAQGTSTASQASRAAAAVEVGQLISQLASLGNAKHGDHYLFAGFKSDAAPFSSTGTYSGDSNEAQLEVSPGAKVTVDVAGDRLLKGADGDQDIFTALSGLKTALESNNPGTVQARISELDGGRSHLSKIRAEVGARMRRLEGHQDHLAGVKLTTQEALSNVEEADFTKVLTDLASREAAYEAALASSARILQLGLLQFLR